MKKKKKEAELVQSWRKKEDLQEKREELMEAVDADVEVCSFYFISMKEETIVAERESFGSYK